ncbi:hypothetical protein [Serratia inhibens]|uniref:hypothetical protein n=1 Tax=Serratia inhibens TaxID=2338073 RepID=UPI0008094940|nr:hypothetical protein [Serratia inhibens]ANS41844.1 hypothetical protein Q5A_006875 [Serratia inhibens PRI-2C]
MSSSAKVVAREVTVEMVMSRHRKTMKSLLVAETERLLCGTSAVYGKDGEADVTDNKLSTRASMSELRRKLKA